jgi:hypothetical protein
MGVGLGAPDSRRIQALSSVLENPACVPLLAQDLPPSRCGHWRYRKLTPTAASAYRGTTKDASGVPSHRVVSQNNDDRHEERDGNAASARRRIFPTRRRAFRYSQRPFREYTAF